MIDVDKRIAIFRLHREGMSLREISRALHVNRHTVRAIIQQQGKIERKSRGDKISVDAELLARLYRECEGWIQRVHERLREEERIDIGYSTLTRLLRELGLSQAVPQRCDRVPDQPGLEMQHDTSVYDVLLGTQRTRLIASLIYLRYSKRRYLRFYRAFNRFAMKCFFHEALMFWGHAARQCVIDNTNLARLRGVGRSAIIVPEMETFARHYGFRFLCHELEHPNRKAGEERSFWTVETNFLPGRTFADLDDLNTQAKTWATERMEHRPQTRARVIPAKLFEHEQAYLQRLPAYLPAPYREHERDIDQYGYIPFHGNHYWIPGTGRGWVKVLEYADHLRIFARQECLIEYPLAPEGVREKHFAPEGQPMPRHAPRPRHREAKLEDQQLRSMEPEVGDYLDFAVSRPGVQRHRFTRALFALCRKLTHEVFLRTIRRAHRYGIVDHETLERIAWLCLSETESHLPSVQIDEELSLRPAYQEGYLTDTPDLSVYDQPATQSSSDHDNNTPPEPHHEDIPW
jgi:transposase